MVMDGKDQIYAGTGIGLYKGSAKGDWVLLTKRLFANKKGM